jgi:splicing factor 4
MNIVYMHEMVSTCCFMPIYACTCAAYTGGIIDGGTWEHRKRAKEMLETAARNVELTAMAAGRHHMGDFLPKDELDKFLKRAEAVTKGESAPVEDDYEAHKLTEDNVGFQLLKKAGWSEGAGLGAGSDSKVASGSSGAPMAPSSSSDSNSNTGGNGIVNPINMAAGGRGPEGTGVGVQATHEVSQGDNEFDQYRKRMMLAYRFRPNPMNNPRRNYY